MLGTGISISFASGFFAEILDLSPPSATREAIKTSHMQTTGAHTFQPADLVDWGECEVQIAFDPSAVPPIDQPAESVVITFPDGGSSTWTFQAFMTGYKPGAPLEERATATCTLKVTGDVEIG